MDAITRNALILPPTRRPLAVASCLPCQAGSVVCDRFKPICSPCRTGAGYCAWPTASLRPAEGLRLTGRESPPKHNRTTYAPNQTRFSGMGFDDPAILRTGLTCLNSEHSRNVFQYICDRGHSIARYATPMIENMQTFNVFRASLVMNRDNPGITNAYLAIGAKHLSYTSDGQPADALAYYQASILGLRHAMALTATEPAPEWVITTALILATFEMFHFVNPTVRKTHFFGWVNLMQSRLRLAPNSWGPARLSLEWYIYYFSCQYTFWPELASGKTFTYIDALVPLLNQVPRPLGPEICGVPSLFLTTAYKLAYVCEKPLERPIRAFELICVEHSLESWQPELRLYAPPNREKLLIARLYHLACLVWTKRLLCSVPEPKSDIFQEYVSRAVTYLQDLEFPFSPPICITWPLAILGIAATNPEHREVLRVPIETLMHQSYILGFNSLLSFLDVSWGDGPGSSTYLGIEAIFRVDLLQHVHV